MVGEKGFEQEGGSYLVDEVLTVEALGGLLAFAMAGVAEVEEIVGFAGGEAFVEQMVREGGVLREKGSGEGFGLFRLRAPGTIGVQGKTDDEGMDFVLADEASDGFEVGGEPGAVEGEERLGGEAETVGDGEADAAIADVESHDAAEGHGDSVGGGWWFVWAVRDSGKAGPSLCSG